MLYSQQVVSQVNDGSYFDRAKEWFSTSVTTTYSSYFYIVLATLFSLFMFFITFTSLRKDYNSVQILLPVLNEDTVNKIHRIEKLDISYNEPKLTLLSNLLQKYIINRENFSPADLKDKRIYNNVNMVSGMSTHQVFGEYISELKRKLSKDKMENTKILNIRFNSKDHNTAIADISTNNIQYSITIKFTISELTDILKNNSKLNFMILKYNKKRHSDNV